MKRKHLLIPFLITAGLILSLILAGCADDDGGAPQLGAKPAKSFITGANVYAVLSNGTEVLFTEQNGTYEAKMTSTQRKNIEFFYSEGGIIEAADLAVDPDIRLEGLYDGEKVTLVTPLTTMWKSSVNDPTNSTEVENKKKSATNLLSADYGLNATKDIAGDPDEDAELEGAAWYVYGAIKGAKDTLKQSGVGATADDVKDLYANAVNDYEQNASSNLEGSVGNSAKAKAKAAGKSDVEANIIGSIAKNSAGEAKNASADIEQAAKDKNATALKESAQLIQVESAALSQSYNDVKDAMDKLAGTTGQNATETEIDNFVKNIGASITKDSVKQANAKAKADGLEDNEDVVTAIIQKAVKTKVAAAGNAASYQNATDAITPMNATEINNAFNALKKSILSVHDSLVSFPTNVTSKALVNGTAAFTAQLPLNNPNVGLTLAYEGDEVAETNMPFAWMLQKAGSLVDADTNATLTYKGNNATFVLDQVAQVNGTEYVIGTAELAVPLEDLSAGTYNFRAAFKPEKGKLAANATQSVDFVTFKNLPKGVVVWDKELNKLSGYGMNVALTIEAAATTTETVTTTSAPATTTAPVGTTTAGVGTTTVPATTTAPVTTTTAGVEYWTPPTGYAKDTSVTQVPSDAGITVYSNYTPGSPPSPGADVYVDLDGDGAADAKLTFVAAATGTTVYVEYNNTVKEYTVAAGTSAGSPYDWSADDTTGQTEPPTTTTTPVTTTTAAAEYWTPPTGYAKDTSVTQVPSDAGVTVYSDYTPGSPPSPGADVYVDLDGDGGADVKLTFVAAATGKTVYIEYNNTVKEYTVAAGTSAGSPYDWSADDTTGQTEPPSYWTPPTGYAEDSSVTQVPSDAGVTVYSNYTPGSPPSPGADVYADLDGDGAADVKLTFVAAATGKTVYIEYNKTVKEYTVAAGTSAGSPYDWSADDTTGQTQ